MVPNYKCEDTTKTVDSFFLDIFCDDAFQINREQMRKDCETVPYEMSKAPKICTTCRHGTLHQTNWNIPQPFASTKTNMLTVNYDNVQTINIAVRSLFLNKSSD